LITIIDLGISNIKSITRGFFTRGFEVKVTSEKKDVLSAESLVLPGVGAFPSAVEVLMEKGLFEAVKAHALDGKPLLGVCLGMQLLFSESEEHGSTKGLGILPGKVIRFPFDRPVPHMGWNEVKQVKKSILFRGIPDLTDFYFVHSYYAKPEDEELVTGYSDHHGRFIAAVEKGNVFGTQFHPEKSQDHGLKLLENFALITEEPSSVNKKYC